MLRNSFYSLISRLSAAFLKLGAYLYLAKVMNIEDYGRFSFYMAITYVVSLVLLFGMNNSIIQVYSSLKNIRLLQLVIYYSKLISLTLALFSFLLFFSFLTIFFTTEHAFILSLAFSTQLLFMVVQSINLAENKMRSYILLPIIQLSLFWVMVLNQINYNPLNIVQAYSLSCFVVIPLLFPKEIKKINKRKFKIILLRLWKYGIKHLMFEINNVVINRSDIFILKVLGLEILLGYYAIIKNIIEGLMYLPKALQPIILRDFNETFNDLFKKINFILTSFYLILLISFIVIGEKIILLIWNVQYLIIYDLLILYLAGFIFYSKGVLNSYKLLNLKLFNEAIKTNIIYALILFLGNYLGVIVSQKYGIGISYFLSSIMYYIYTIYILKRRVSS